MMKKELLTCCRTDAELEQMRMDAESGDHRARYRIQSNLTQEKTGWRCATCGKFYRMVEVHYNGVDLDRKSLSKPLGRRLKYKKWTRLFRGDHYYATQKKSLLRFDIDSSGTGVLTDEIPIMGDVEYFTVSGDDQLIATETFGKTAAVIDAVTKETIAKRRKLEGGNNFRFFDRDHLIYFKHNTGIFLWNFRENRETCLWTPPESWRNPQNRLVVCCFHVLEPEKGTLVYQLTAGVWCFALILDGLTPREPIRLPDTRALSSLTYCAERYVLPLLDRAVVYDKNFRPIRELAYPEVITRNDGGIFPIEIFSGQAPYHVHLSPNGRWALFDFHAVLLLLDLEADKVRYFLWNHWTTSTGSGFLDDHRLWYSWADSTYIMEL
jgi:hypothetical protein